jgi:hypothetical protein
VAPEPMEEFEKELRQAFERRPAPPRLKRKLMEEVLRRREAGLRRPFVWWPRLAAVVAAVIIVTGAVLWRQAQERREGEAVRRQVLTAFRITTRALHEMNTRLAARNRGTD